MSRFSETLMDHFQYPRNRGVLPDPDFRGAAGNPSGGRFIGLQGRVSEGRVAEVRFEAQGCGVTIAIGSVLTELVLGMSRDECLALTSKDIADALDGLPPDRSEHADLGLAALRDGLLRWP